MKFQFKLWILICVNVYLNILGLVYALHIRSPSTLTNNACITRNSVVWPDGGPGGWRSYSLKDALLNSGHSTHLGSDSRYNVSITTTHTGLNVSNFKLKLTKSQYSFITSFKVGGGHAFFEGKIHTRPNYGTNIDSAPLYSFNGSIGSNTAGWILSRWDKYGDRGGERSRRMQLRAIPIDPSVQMTDDNLQGRIDDIVRGFLETSRGPVYKNEMDELIDMCNEADHLYEKYKNWDEVYKEMGIDPPVKVSNHTLVCLARNLLNRPAPPKDYFGKMLHELGVLMMYRNLKRMLGTFVKRVEKKITNPEPEDFKRNPEYVFGIEPLGFGEKVQPLTERCVRGFLDENYFDHLQEMARFNPRRAQKILTVIHRIYQGPELRSDVSSDVTDYEILDDVDKIIDAQNKSYVRFLGRYPDLKWPANDEDHLDLYREWYDPGQERSLKLTTIIKDTYLDSYRPQKDGMRIWKNAVLSSVWGLSLGKASELFLEALYDRYPDLVELAHKSRKSLKYIFGGLAYLILSDRREEHNYFYELVKYLYADLGILEQYGLEQLVKEIGKGSRELGARELTRLTTLPSGDVGQKASLAVDPQLDSETEDELLKDVLRVRREDLTKMAINKNVSQYDFKLNMEKTGMLLTFKAFLRLMSMYPYDQLYDSKVSTLDELYGKKPVKKEEEEEEEEYLEPSGDPEWDSILKESREMRKKNLKVDRRIQRARPGMMEELFKLLSNLKYVNALAIPLSQTSVFRQFYRIGSTLAVMGHLPCTDGMEVLGYYISGEDFVGDGRGPKDDYSKLYEKCTKESGLPPENVPQFKHNALLLTSFLIQVFSNMDGFVTSTKPRNFGNELDTDELYMRRIGVAEEQIDMFKKSPKMPSTLDELEDWAVELEKNGGYVRRFDVKYKYGIVPCDELFGETKDQYVRRKVYEIETKRDHFLSLFNKRDRMVEILKAMSMILHVTEDFLLENMPEFWVNFVANLVYSDLDNIDGDFSKYARGFNMSPRGAAYVKHRVMQVYFQALRHSESAPAAGDASQTSTTYGQSGHLVPNHPFNEAKQSKGDRIKKIFSDLKRICSKLEISEDGMYDYFRVFMFKDLVEDLRELDLARVTRDDLELIKRRYESTDIVLVNALCEVIKQRVNETKNALLEASGLEDFYLVEKHVQTLILTKRALSRATRGLIDEKYAYRINRALQHNKMYMPKDFTFNEILGTDHFMPPPLTRHWFKFRFQDDIKRSTGVDGSDLRAPDEPDRLRELNGDWELVDEEDEMTEIERMKYEEEQEKKNVKPLKLYGIDTNSSIQEELEMDEMIKKGRFPEELRLIPNVFHVGEREINTDYDPSAKMPEDKYPHKRALLETPTIFKAWVIYTYRKRESSLPDKEDFVTVFPATKELINSGIKDWKYLYVRLAIRNDDLSATRDWVKELDANSSRHGPDGTDEVRKVLEYCYEEELLRVTKGAMQEVEDDIGNTTDFFFNPFDPSTNKRMDYVYSQALPNEEQLERLKKVQKFLRLSKAAVENIHSKCLSYALDCYFRSMLYKYENETLRNLVREYFKPISQKLNISQVSYTNILTKSVFDHLTSKFVQFFDKCPIGNTYLRSVDRFLGMCTNLEVLTPRELGDGQGDVKGTEVLSKFSPTLDTPRLTHRVVENFILSSLEVHNKVDMGKLDLLCNVVGLRGERRVKALQEMGDRLYYKYMVDHHKDNIFMETFDELKHLHGVYGFDESCLRKILYNYRLFKVLDAYEGYAGLAEFNKCLAVIEEDDVNKYYELDKDMKINWFMKILEDLVEKKRFDVLDYLELAGPNYLARFSDPLGLQERSPALAVGNSSPSGTHDAHSDSTTLSSNVIDPDPAQVSTHSDSNTLKDHRQSNVGARNELVKFITLVMDKLDLRDNEFLEACFLHVDTSSVEVLEKVNKLISASKQEREFDPLAEEKEQEAQNNIYRLLLDFFKIVSLTPKNMIGVVRDKFRPGDVTSIRKILIQNSHSMEEQFQTLKLVDIYLDK